MQRVPRSVQALQAPPKMAHRRVVEVMSAWLVEDFDPKLAPWLLTCKDAIEPVRQKLEEERDHKDKVMRWALSRLRLQFNGLMSGRVRRV